MSFDLSMLEGSLNPKCVFETLKYRNKFTKEHPDFFDPEGLLVFCGSQGSGKTLSAVQYIKKLCIEYPRAILVTNTRINGLPAHTAVVQYEGIESLTKYENGEFGVIYFIDEIHLEFNSLESKNVPIEVMVEVSQQRKQRKHIVGTSQVYMRMAKALREQIKNVVICKNILGCLQINRLVNGETARELDGELKFDTTKLFAWFHSPELYSSYDTYAKMKRYSKEWKGVSGRSLYENSN
ncbi:MAG: ATP-binding protein [Clostridia bacterium]|nr:ATP-binding protein [Clostridia bacterium]